MKKTLFYSQKRHPFRWISLFLVVVLFSLVLYVIYDNGRFVVKHQDVYVENLPSELEGFSVALVSDLCGKSFGTGNQYLINSITSSRCSAVICCGDMIGKTGNAQPFFNLIEGLSVPVFFVEGDCDPTADTGIDAYHSTLPDWVESAKLRGAHYLDVPFCLTYNKQTVWLSNASILGLSLDTTLNAYGSSTGAAADYNAQILSQTIAARDSLLIGGLHIAVSHLAPEDILLQRAAQDSDETVRAWINSVDLLVSGGTCGGQWRIPYFSPDKPDYGYIGSCLSYTTRGLGVDGFSSYPAFRLLNTPEITILTFTGSYTDNVLP